jgi:hypothetical protein
MALFCNPNGSFGWKAAVSRMSAFDPFLPLARCLLSSIANIEVLSQLAAIRGRRCSASSVVDGASKMSRFEFPMGFYGLILGLALTRLMAEFADLLRSRDRGKLGLLVAAGVALLFVQIMATFFDAYIKLQHTAPNFAGLA